MSLHSWESDFGSVSEVWRWMSSELAEQDGPISWEACNY